jgi:DNA-binding MarR family transcriptional regulator
MVQQEPGPDDSTATYTLTPAGREAVEKLVAARRASLARLLDGWSPDQHVDLAQLLTRLATELVGERPAEVPAGS